jgi:hypothetical protein
MIENNYRVLVDKYEDYLKSTEALAVYLVKAYVKQIDTRNKWVDIVSSNTYHKSDKTAFNYLIVEIFDRKTHPVYPKKAEGYSEYGYRQICRAITWEVSHNDIWEQREKGIRGQLYFTIIPVFDKNRGKKLIIEKPFWNEEYGGFDYTGKVPTSTKKVEEDMKPEWDYFVKVCRKITDDDAVRIEKNFGLYIAPRIFEERKNLVEWYFVEYETIKKAVIKDKKIKKLNKMQASHK